jgi:hypothetical protein
MPLPKSVSHRTISEKNLLGSNLLGDCCMQPNSEAIDHISTFSTGERAANS